VTATFVDYAFAYGRCKIVVREWAWAAKGQWAVVGPTERLGDLGWKKEVPGQIGWLGHIREWNRKMVCKFLDY
jgi:hypothetical protein